MPLLRRQAFQKASGSELLKDGDEVFYCEPTGEIFSSYEDYFHRVMLISSMVWSCALTGRPNLTYAEALESEKAARRLLKTFPDAVKGPFLLVATHTRRTAINEMHEDVYSYVKDLLFKGEEVDAFDPVLERFRRARIMKVVANGSPSKQKASNLIYHVMALDHYAPKVWTALGQTLKRDRHSMTRDKCKLFLKQHVEGGPGGLLRIKPSSLEQYVHGEGWTDDQVFFGHVPDFELSKKLKLREERSKALANGQEKRKQTAAVEGSEGGGIVKPPEKKKRQNKNPTSKGKGKIGGVAGEERDQKQIVGANNKQPSMAQYLERSQDDIESRARMMAEQLLLLKEKAEQEAAAKKRLEEEKVLLMQQVALALKKYNAVYEDQELTDQRVMPPVRPVRSMIPAKHFGNFVFVLEFLNSFIDLLANRSKFPNGITMELLERALLLREVNGPLSDIFQVLLGAIFAQQAEEENEVDVRYRRPENLAQKRLSVPEQARARDAAVWIEKHYCGKLHELPLDSTTLSEVLRLHILSSGALVEDKAAKFRYYNRGGYVNADDPGLRLVHDYPHILRALKSYPVYQLPIGDVIQLLCCLIHQLLTYSSVRELIEERIERARVVRTNYQTNRAAQRRVIVKTGSQKYVAREDMKKELAAFTGGEGPDKEALRRQLQERMEEQCAAIEADAQSQLKQLQAESDKLKEDFFDYQIYLGTDRSFRNYWLFESLPGLFVEHNRTFAGRCLDQPTINITALANCPSEMRRKFISKSIMTAASRGSLISRIRDGDTATGGSNGGEIEVYEQLLIEGSAELERSLKEQTLAAAVAAKEALEQQQQHVVGQEQPEENGTHAVEDSLPIIEPTTNHTRPPTNEELLMCTANPDNCPVHTDHTDTVSWGFYETAEELDALIRSLNVRGTREKQLRETLECERDLIVTHIEKCPSGRLTVEPENRARFLVDMVVRTQRKYDAPNFSQDPGTEPNEVMEVVFREYLLELESKISVGYLGVMRVRDRQQWREAIELRGYDPQTDETLQWGPKRLAKLEAQQNGGKESGQDSHHEKQEQQQEQPSGQGAGVKDKDDDLHGSDDDSEWDDIERLLSNAKDPGYGLPDTTVALLDETIDDESSLTYPLHESDSLQARVQEMARALLQVEQCIDQKFLRHPFGPAKKHKDRNVMLQRQFEGQKNLIKWEVSLMRSTCFAQLFLHYAVLYDAIQWSRSAERISCMTCRRKGDPDLTLLCDECNRACHIYCLKPKLKQVPEGDWFCMRCRPEQHKVKKPPAAAKKKKIFKWEEENEDEEEEQEEEENMEEEEEDQENEEMMVDEEEVEDGLAREEDVGSDEEEGTGGGKKKSKSSKTTSKSGTGGKGAATKGAPATRSSRSASYRNAINEEVFDDMEDEVEEEEEEEEDYDDTEEFAGNDSDDYAENGRAGRSGRIRISTAKRKRTQGRLSSEDGRASKRSRQAVAKRALTNGKSAKVSPRPTTANSRATSSEKQLYDGSESDVPSGKRVSARSTKGRRRSPFANGTDGGAETSDGNETVGGINTAPRRSRRTGEDLPLNSVALYTLIDDILKHPDSWPFNRPVSAKEVPDYYKVIKTPMDFARVKSKLNMGDYKINEQMLADVQLVFRNCDLYNTDETDVYRIGRELERYVVKRCKELSLPFAPSDMQKTPFQQNGPAGGGSASRKVNGVANHAK
uniref:Bromodomain adjacent to zinc finger domain protein 1A n=1 Tax=Anopheles atroparvus TaxID=41427 RepID=A0AAG5DLK4_ANOAO